MECFGGWEKGEPGEARGRGGQHGWRGPAGGGQHGPRGRGARAGKDRAGQGRGGGGKGGEGRAGGDLHLIKQKYNFFKKLFSL